MLTVHQITKSYTLETVLWRVSFDINPGERWGLIGPNGCGKTTLLRILAGLEKPDSGSLHIDPPDLRIGYLPQGLAFSSLNTAGAQTIQAFLEQQLGDLPAVEARLQELAVALSQHPQGAGLQAEYDRVLAQLELSSRSASRLPATLAALGLENLSLQTPVDHLSGGQKTRLALAGVLLSEPQLLLLDEPTNHLDLEMLAWLEDWLLGFRGAVLVVSHDRAFLDRIASAILEIDSATHALRAYPGNYTAYLEQKLSEVDRRWQEYQDQQDEIVHLRASASRMRATASFTRGGKGDSGDKFAKGFFGNRAKGTIARAKHLERRLEQLLTVDRLEKPHRDWQMKLDFSGAPTGRAVLSLEKASIGYDGQPLLLDLDLHTRYGARVAIVGPNGAGKTTLLRTIAGKLAPIHGSVHLGTNVRLGFMTQEQEDLDPQANALTTILRAAPFNETEARTFLHQFLFSGDAVFLPAGRLSYGERARLTLACLVAGGCNLLLLDEPINHLDIPSRARFEQALAAFEGSVLAVSHDRYFIDGFASEIWELVPSGEAGRTRYTLNCYPV